MLQKNMTPVLVQRGNEEEVKPKAWELEVSYSTTCQNEVPTAHPMRTTWQQSKIDFFLFSFVSYLFCLYPVVTESLVSILLCKSYFNNKVLVVLGGADRTLETTSCIVSLWINILHMKKAYKRIAWANSKPWGVPTACQQGLTSMEPGLSSSGVGQWPQTDGLFLQNASCRKVYLKVLGKSRNVI